MSAAFRPRKVINIHAHLHRGEDAHAKIAQWKAQGAVRTCVQCLDWANDNPREGYMNSRDVAPLLRQYPDHLIGFGDVRLTNHPPDLARVDELSEQGFRGLKLIMPARPYDDDLYMPLYQAAARRGLALFFHTGHMAFPPNERGPSAMDHMRPVRLERIARFCPNVPVIGAHLGTPWAEEAITEALSNPNLYFDFCGGGASVQRGTLLKRALRTFPGADMADPEQNLALRLVQDKLLFGTDNPTVEQWVVRSEDVLDYLRIPAAIRENFYWKTAARILGISDAV